MEDIGVIINKNGKQYITNLIGKNTNQIIINENKFTSLDVDKLIDFVNIFDNIISIVIEYDNHSIDIWRYNHLLIYWISLSVKKLPSIWLHVYFIVQSLLF